MSILDSFLDSQAETGRLLRQVGEVANSEKSAIWLEGVRLGLKYGCDLFMDRPRDPLVDPYTGKVYTPDAPTEAVEGPK